MKRRAAIKLEKKKARRRRFVTHTNRQGMRGRRGKFDLLLTGKLRLPKKTTQKRGLIEEAFRIIGG